MLRRSNTLYSEYLYISQSLKQRFLKFYKIKESAVEIQGLDNLNPPLMSSWSFFSCFRNQDKEFSFSINL